MDSSARRLWAALSVSLAVHGALVWSLAGREEAPTTNDLIEEIFLEVEPMPAQPPEEAPPPAPEEVTPPEEVTEAEETPTPQPKVAAAPEIAEKPIPNEELAASPVVGEDAPSPMPGEGNTPEAGGVEGIGEDPNAPSGKEGLPWGGGINLDPKKQLPLGTLGGIVDASKPKGSARKAFVLGQLGGATIIPLSSVNAGNHKPLGKVKKLFVGYLRKMHERIHPQWAGRVLEGFTKVTCESPLNNIDMQVTLELVLDEKGNLERAAPIVSSGDTSFDAAAVTAAYDSGTFPAPPESLRSYDGKVYVHWVFHRDERQCGSNHAKAYILTGEASSQPGSQPTEEKELTPEEEELIAKQEKIFPTLPESKGFGPAFKEAIFGMAKSCKEKLELIRDDIQREGLIRGILKEQMIKMAVPPTLPDEDDLLHLIEASLPKFCKEAMAYQYKREFPLGPPDDISSPAVECDPSCRELCFTW